MGYLDANGLARFYDGLKDKFVQTVNGQTPVNGNVALSGIGRVAEEFSVLVHSSDWEVAPGYGFTGSGSSLTACLWKSPDYSASDLGVNSIGSNDILLFTGVLNPANTANQTHPSVRSWEAKLGSGVVYFEFGAFDRDFVTRPSVDLYMTGIIIHGYNKAHPDGYKSSQYMGTSPYFIDFVRKNTSLFKIVEKVVDNKSIAAGDRYTTEITFTAPSGYHGIVIKNLTLANATTSGAGAGNCRLYGYSCSTTGSCTARIANDGSSTAKIKINLQILCVRDDIRF